MKFIITILFLISVTTYCKGQPTNDCMTYRKWEGSYKIFNSLIPEKSKSFMFEVMGEKKHKFVSYGKIINNLIVNKNIHELLKHISKKSFVMYAPGVKKSNIVNIIHAQLIEKKGNYYNMIFDTMKIWEGLKDFNPEEYQKLDIRKYLICFKNKIKWRVLYNSQLDAYIVKFSIHDWAIEHLQYFKYIVKEENGKFILVGF